MPKTEVFAPDRDEERQGKECESSDFSAAGIQSAVSNVDSSLVSATVLRIWQDLLHVNDVEPSDDFFDLGGDSLAAIRMLEHIGREFGEELLEPDIIYSSSQFEELTSAITNALAKRGSQSPVMLQAPHNLSNQA